MCQSVHDGWSDCLGLVDLKWAGVLLLPRVDRNAHMTIPTKSKTGSLTEWRSIMAFAVAMTGSSMLFGAEPPRRLRVPDDAILTDDAQPTSRADAVTADTKFVQEPSTPVRVSFRTERVPDPASHDVHLGTRDDSKSMEYALDGIRGSESPKGPKHGRYCEPGMQRAGQPWCVSPWAKCSVGSDYTVGYVGGGSPFARNSERRTIHEGTFGMDYSGVFFTRNTWLRWTHGGRHQGGYGRYETEGPRILPEK
jgi:hypothetical protein